MTKLLLVNVEAAGLHRVMTGRVEQLGEQRWCDLRVCGDRLPDQVHRVAGVLRLAPTLSARPAAGRSHRLPALSELDPAGVRTGRGGLRDGGQSGLVRSVQLQCSPGQRVIP